MARVHAQTHFELYYTSIRWAHFSLCRGQWEANNLGTWPQ